MATSKKDDKSYVLNPVTGRYVKRDGKIGRGIVVPDVRQAILHELQNKSHNDYDPITLERFDEMSEEQLCCLIPIGNADLIKKNYYLLDSIYGVYSTAVLNGCVPKDPLNPAHVLTQHEIDLINAKKLELSPTYTPPQVLNEQYPDGLTIDISSSRSNPSFYKIVVMLYDLVLENFGLVPGWVEASHTGSVDYTSGVLLTNIYILWRRHLFLNLEGNRTSLSLYKTAAYWRRNLVQKFIALCEQVKNLLDL